MKHIKKSLLVLALPLLLVSCGGKKSTKPDDNNNGNTGNNSSNKDESLEYGLPSYAWVRENGEFRCIAEVTCITDATKSIVEVSIPKTYVVEEMTCTKDGEYKYVAEFKDSHFFSQVKSMTISKEHAYSFEYTWDEFTVTAKATCSKCSDVTTETKEATKVSTNDQSCYTVSHYSVEFENDLFEDQEKDFYDFKAQELHSINYMGQCTNEGCNYDICEKHSVTEQHGVSRPTEYSTFYYKYDLIPGDYQFSYYDQITSNPETTAEPSHHTVYDSTGHIVDTEREWFTVTEAGTYYVSLTTGKRGPNWAKMFHSCEEIGNDFKCVVCDTPNGGELNPSLIASFSNRTAQKHTYTTKNEILLLYFHYYDNPYTLTVSDENGNNLIFTKLSEDPKSNYYYYDFSSYPGEQTITIDIAVPERNTDYYSIALGSLSSERVEKITSYSEDHSLPSDNAERIFEYTLEAGTYTVDIHDDVNSFIVFDENMGKLNTDNTFTITKTQKVYINFVSKRSKGIRLIKAE